VRARSDRRTAPGGNIDGSTLVNQERLQLLAELEERVSELRGFL
jgi:hypothetical protein